MVGCRVGDGVHSVTLSFHADGDLQEALAKNLLGSHGQFFAKMRQELRFVVRQVYAMLDRPRRVVHEAAPAGQAKGYDEQAIARSNSPVRR